ncbi:MAG: ketoacyl-ACP synthase III [Pirellulaceae bacterium]
MKFAGVGPISIHLPEKTECNEDLQRENPSWDMAAIGSKTGIDLRHVAAPDECSSDLAVAAAEKLFEQHNIDPSSIDYLLFCTQTPDYSLPTTACLLQQRLGLSTSTGALDFNLGCSGFVYGLSLADGLIRSGAAKRILFLTAETYTKLIHPTDRSLRTIFGDAAAATLIDAVDEPTLSGFQFGTDGSGADTLIASRGGFRNEQEMIKPRHRKRWPSDLYMDGPSLISFTVGKIPELVNAVCEKSGVAMNDVRHLLFHQATRKMLEQLHIVLGVDEKRLPIRLEGVGNTVSCTLPILIEQMRNDGLISPGDQNMLVGFGVGWSWAGCMWRDQFASM